MTFREKIAESIVNKLYPPTPDTGMRRTIAVTKYKKDAIALLREFRECGDLYGESLAALLRALDDEHASGTRGIREANLRHRLATARVSVADQKISLYEGIVYIFQEKDIETVINTLQSTGRPFDIIADDACSPGIKRMTSEPSEDALADIGSWIDSIPVIEIKT